MDIEQYTKQYAPYIDFTILFLKKCKLLNKPKNGLVKYILLISNNGIDEILLNIVIIYI